MNQDKENIFVQPRPGISKQTSNILKFHSTSPSKKTNVLGPASSTVQKRKPLASKDKNIRPFVSVNNNDNNNIVPLKNGINLNPGTLKKYGSILGIDNASSLSVNNNNNNINTKRSIVLKDLPIDNNSNTNEEDEIECISNFQIPMKDPEGPLPFRLSSSNLKTLDTYDYDFNSGSHFKDHIIDNPLDDEDGFQTDETVSIKDLNTDSINEIAEGNMALELDDDITETLPHIELVENVLKPEEYNEEEDLIALQYDNKGLTHNELLDLLD